MQPVLQPQSEELEQMVSRELPKAIILNEADIPSKFWKAQDPKLDRKAVLDALKAKEAVAGAELSNGGETIQIRWG
jgi:hypothetical protein